MTELEGKNEVRQLIDRLDLRLIQLGPVGSREFAAVMPAACQLRQDMNAKWKSVPAAVIRRENFELGSKKLGVLREFAPTVSRTDGW